MDCYFAECGKPVEAGLGAQPGRPRSAQNSAEENPNARIAATTGVARTSRGKFRAQAKRDDAPATPQRPQRFGVNSGESNGAWHAGQ